MKIRLIIITFLIPVAYLKAQTISTVPAQDTTVYTRVDKNAAFPGGPAGLAQYLHVNLIYPESARKANLQGRVFVSFTVEKEGNLSNLTIAKGVSPEMDTEALRVLSSGPTWSPGQRGGVAVRSRYTLPLNFLLTDTAKTPFAPAEIPAQYPGGLPELNRYLNISLIYPARAREDNISGKVYVSFIVEKDGSLTDFKISKPLTPETDAEAIRLMKNSKKWIPATAKGSPIKQQCTILVNFQLDDR